MEAAEPRHSVCMVCDFVYPRLGGVEMHIWSVAQSLLRLGHRVCVVTNAYAAARPRGAAAGGPPAQRIGVRVMAHGLRVYYMPMPPMAEQTVLPTYTAGFPLFRRILLRERVTIVHGHAATSVLMHECLLQARTMGVRTCYTDHSLFSFNDFVGININKYLKLTLTDVEHCICVSHTCRENLVLRAAVDPRKVSTIPNAVDIDKFRPTTMREPAAAAGGATAALASPAPSLLQPLQPRVVTVVVVSRLVYRKGIDLLVGVIPAICARLLNVRFVIGGDGPKRLLLEEMRERHRLQHRVELLGAVPHSRVRDVLCRGDIFLNCSLTESFCTAVLEAACCGLFVVSTLVGGLPEVLPERMVAFAEQASAQSLVEALAAAVPRVVRGEVDPWSFHAELRDHSVYNWPSVARRTLRVYDLVAATPALSLLERFRRLYGAGRVFGPVAVALAAIIYFYLLSLELFFPACDVDVVPFIRPELWDDIAEDSDEAIAAAHAAADPWAPAVALEAARPRLLDPPASSVTSLRTTASAPGAAAAGSVAGFAPTSLQIRSGSVPAAAALPATMLSTAVAAESVDVREAEHMSTGEGEGVPAVVSALPGTTAAGSSDEEGEAGGAFAPFTVGLPALDVGLASGASAGFGFGFVSTAADGTVEATPRHHWATGPAPLDASADTEGDEVEGELLCGPSERGSVSR